jgi:hypothetical protein
MARIVGIHGIAQQVRGPEVLRAAWAPALGDGVFLSGAQPPDEADLEIAFYGDLFRARGGKAVGDPPYTAVDVEEGFERELLEAWWAEAVSDEAVPGPGKPNKTKLRTPKTVQRALNALSQSRFFADLTERLIIGFIKQVHAYLDDDAIRAKIQARVDRVVGPSTTVLVGHSLGSVVADEAACRIRAGIWLWSRWGARLASATLSSTVSSRRRPAAAGSSQPVPRRGPTSPTLVMWWRW